MSHRYDATAEFACTTVDALVALAALPYNAERRDAMLDAAGWLARFAIRITATEEIVNGLPALDGHAIEALHRATEAMEPTGATKMIDLVRDRMMTA